MTNAERAALAKPAVEQFARTTGSELWDEAIRDLVTNLMHLCDEHGIDPIEAVDKATRMYEEEKEEDT